MNKDIESSVSISIVTFNNQSDIVQKLGALSSFFSSPEIKQVIVVDNASTDGTLDILRNYAERESKMRVVALDVNQGFGYGHNVAIRKASEKYHLIMNLDVVPKTNNIMSEMVAMMESRNEIGMLSPLIEFPDGSVQMLTRKQPTVLDLMLRFLGPGVWSKRQDAFVNKHTGYTTEQKIENASGSFMFFRKTVLDEINGFDERYFLYMEDTDITRSTNVQSIAWFNPKIVVTHEWQRENHTMGGAKRMVVSMVKYFNKWGWKLF